MGTIVTSRRVQRGKAPPVECFSGEDANVTWDDWLATLEHAAIWYGWNKDEKLLQLAGHLKDKAIQEWNLMEDSDKSSYNRATVALKGRIDQGSSKLAAQDFCHAAQRAKETLVGEDFQESLWEGCNSHRNQGHPSFWSTTGRFASRDYAGACSL